MIVVCYSHNCIAFRRATFHRAMVLMGGYIYFGRLAQWFAGMHFSLISCIYVNSCMYYLQCCITISSFILASVAYGIMRAL